MMDEIKKIIEDAEYEVISESDAELLVALETEDVEPCNQDAEDDASDADTTDEHLQKIAELEEKLRLAEEERATRERELLCLTLLGEAGLPAGLAPAVMAAEDMPGAIGLIRDTVRSAVTEQMRTRCRSDAPITGGNAPLTKEELIRLPVAELQRMRDYGAALRSGASQ